MLVLTLLTVVVLLLVWQNRETRKAKLSRAENGCLWLLAGGALFVLLALSTLVTPS